MDDNLPCCKNCINILLNQYPKDKYRYFYRTSSGSWRVLEDRQKIPIKEETRPADCPQWRPGYDE